MHSSVVMLELLLIAQLSTIQLPEPHELLIHSAIGASIVAHATDISTTMYCRGARKCEEVNPALRWLQDEPIPFAVAKMGVAVGMNALLLKMHKKHPKLVFGLTVAQTIGYGYISYHNSKSLR